MLSAPYESDVFVDFVAKTRPFRIVARGRRPSAAQGTRRRPSDRSERDKTAGEQPEPRCIHLTRMVGHPEGSDDPRSTAESGVRADQEGGRTRTASDVTAAPGATPSMRASASDSCHLSCEAQAGASTSTWRRPSTSRPGRQCSAVSGPTISAHRSWRVAMTGAGGAPRPARMRSTSPLTVAGGRGSTSSRRKGIGSIATVTASHADHSPMVGSTGGPGPGQA